MRPSIAMEVVRAIDQYSGGAITYMEMMSKIVLLMPPPCDVPDADDVYKYLMRGLIDSAEAERKQR